MKQKIWFWVLILFWLLMLLPYLTNGYWGDDALNSSIRGEAALAGTTVFGFMRKINDLWMFEKGRLYPLSWFFVYGGFALFASLKAFRAYQCSLLVANACLFARVLERIGLEKKTVLLFAVLLPAFFQMRAYHDPIASYGGLLQIVGIEFCLSLLGLLGLLEGRGSKFGVLFYLGFSASLLTYEVGLIFVPIYAYFVFTRSKDPWAIARPSCLLLAAYAGASAYLRLHASQTYPGVEPGAGPAFFATSLKQLVAGLPLSYVALSGPPLRVTAASVLASILGAVLFHGISSEQAGPRKRNAAALALGLLLVLGSSAIIGISKRYQTELTWGVGYLPVYFCYFGMALLASLRLHDLRGSGARAVAAVAFACIVLVTRSANVAVEARTDAGDREPRLALESALKNGLLDRVTDGSRLVMEPVELRWANAAFFLQHSGKRVLRDRDTSFTRTVGSPAAATYDLSYQGGGSPAWTLAAGPGAR